MWLKESNGAIYRIDAIAAVTPMEQRADKRDQTKVTAVTAALALAGGQIYHTSLDFAETVEVVNPSKKASTDPANPPT